MSDDGCIGLRQTPSFSKAYFCLFARSDSNLSVQCWQVEISPVYANMVCRLGQNGLLKGSGASLSDTVLHTCLGNGGLSRAINALLGICTQVELHIVGLAVDGTNLIGHIVDGRGEQI